jgi:probable selenium-dependent hydroxylase accessory protein YqeC
VVERDMRWGVEMDSLWTALRLGDGGCVAVIGAGGKTTSILALSHVAVRRSRSVIVTTTTKIWPPVGMPLVVKVAGQDLADQVRRKLLHAPSVAVGGDVNAIGKLVGLEPRDVCDLTESGVADVVLCEADGAAGRSLKVHGPHEPVIPACAVSVAVVAGLDAMGQLPGSEVIHRFERFIESYETDRAQPIDASLLSRVLMLAVKKIDPTTPVVFVLNKADDADARQEARRVAGELAKEIDQPIVIATSHLDFVQRGGSPRKHNGIGSDVRATR